MLTFLKKIDDFMDNFLSDCLGPFVLGLVVSGTIILVPLDRWFAYSCAKYGEITLMETKYPPFTSCYVKTPDYGWVTRSDYREAIVASRLEITHKGVDD